MIYPAGRYNLNFDICSITMCALMLLYLILGRNSLRVRRTRSFFWVVLCMFLGSCGELAMDITRNDNGITFLNWQAELATFVSHVAHNTIPFLLALYFLSLTGLWHGMKKRQFVILSIPEAVLLITHLVPSLRHFIYYYYGNCQYVRGPAYCIYYFIVAFYVIYSAVVLFRNFSAIRRKDRIYVLVLCGGFLLGLFVSIFSNYLKATNFIQTMALTVSFFVLENDEDLLDRATGVYNTEALMRDTYPLFRADYRSYVLSVKLQHFDYYRIMIGVQAMTALMRQVGSWMLGIAYEERTFYRVGSGEFAVLLYNTDAVRAHRTAKRISQRFRQPWAYSENSAGITIPAQIWVSSIPDRVSSEEQVLAFSQSAFDDTRPEDRIIVADEMKEEKRKIDVNVAIRRAIEESGFRVYYQPIYDTAAGKIHSCEALVRMNDPELGYVSPEEFIKVAEQTGTISRIGAIVFEEVCRFLSVKRPERYGLDFVEVNLSTIQCMDKNLVNQFQTIMDQYGVSADQIVLEITESAVIHNEARMNTIVHELEEAGFHFALDDFGTGQANYSYVRRFPFRLIKIDKSFLWAADDSRTDRIILHNMLNLAHDLKIHTVVEGVETAEQRDSLTADGVSYLQGYFYSRPVPAEEFLEYIRNFNHSVEA